MSNDSLSIMQEYKQWANTNDQHGRHAFARYVMLKYLEAVQSISKDFVFKGGNLLWHYIQTPRHTVDLDLSTLTSSSHDEVRLLLTRACFHYENISFNIMEFKEINRERGSGAAITIKYKTDMGQKNQFELDVMYSLPTDLEKVKSTIREVKIQSASLENIIIDKISAAHSFASGNTRIKDFDDLWRIMKSESQIDSDKLKVLFKMKGISPQLDLNWVDKDMQKRWKSHLRLYKDLPSELKEIFQQINIWLDSLN
ncbi:MAG: nucleotidyl transferase AbiEii/AbiGii toxin family protein [Halobacteriovoraceae bacterium]|jgi:hypothetical protein|nr:nucleotidyl transferase AbiEii/AbiGii toxin family protein [Halobacteriovoraceae bacterium]